MLNRVCTEYPCIGNQNIICQAFKQFRFSDFIPVQNIIYNNGTCTISCEEVEEYDMPDWEKKEEELKEKRRTEMTRSLKMKDDKKFTLVNDSK